MQSIYTYIRVTETNYICREYSVAAVLLVLYMVNVTLFTVLNLLPFYILLFFYVRKIVPAVSTPHSRDECWQNLA
jgi:hypothetical protein